MERGAALLLFWSQLDSREGSTHPRGVGGGERGEALVMQDACLLGAPPWSPGAGLCMGHRDPTLQGPAVIGQMCPAGPWAFLLNAAPALLPAVGAASLCAQRHPQPEEK